MHFLLRSSSLQLVNASDLARMREPARDALTLRSPGAFPGGRSGALAIRLAARRLLQQAALGLPLT